ncbi:MAG: 50S ribosomal protein L23 [Dehalococcoidales bacterium]|jgi:large subunit ribosomal protein L23|nr:50S ribosomal protein L23 [Dehalococcoidales bacterium]
MNLHQVLKKPLITEKGTILQQDGKYCFVVADKATKWEIKRAVEMAFDVEVTSVNVMNVAGKERRMGRNIFHEPTWKKAVVSLKEGQSIQLFEGV